MIVYKITNMINGKIYVGKDKFNNSNYLGSGFLIKKSIKKHGKENFKKEILEYCSTEHDLKEKEIKWIEILKSNDLRIGYNITKGGDGGDTLTNHPFRKEILKKTTEAINKVKDKISSHHIDVSGKNNPMFGKKHTEESKQKMSINTKKCFKDNPELIEKLKERMKKTSKGRNNSNYNPTSVLQYDINMNFIKEWEDLYSLKEVGFNSKLISACCRGIYKKSHGFIWRFKP